MTQLIKRSEIKNFPISVFLVDDQEIIAESIFHMLRDEPEIIVHYCKNPANAIEMVEKTHPTVILQDLVMPDIDGLMLLKYFRANPATKNVPLIVLSTNEDPITKAEAFALGANDYLVKLPDKIELIARIRYHSSAYTFLIQRDQAYHRLEESQKMLQNELSEAATYVRSLLPEELKGEIQASWRFIPSALLGGDAFGYHWIDSDNFAFYLLDVCGHGVGAALLSVTVTNVLRSQTLPNTNFLDPSQVLNALNNSFPMEEHNNMFFTIGYGVYNKYKRQIVYSSGGHPPGLLILPSTRKQRVVKLTTPGIVIGAMPSVKFSSTTVDIESKTKLLLFSDGLYELLKEDGDSMNINEFIENIEKLVEKKKDSIDDILEFSKTQMQADVFVDDVSLLELTFT